MFAFGRLQSRYAKAFRILAITARVGILSASIYSTGYYTGVTEQINNPAAVEKTLMKDIFVQNNATAILPTSSKETKRVSTVVQRIIPAAQAFCAVQVEKSKKDFSVTFGESFELALEGNSPMTTAKQLRIDSINEQMLAEQAIQGRWTAVVLDSPLHNAFVVAAFPKKVFVCRGLLDVCNPTDEELAVVLGHEVSHLLHFHTAEGMNQSAILYSAQLVLLALVDPIGITSIAWELMGWIMSRSLTARFSRQHEAEADMTGLQIAAHACYDTSKGSRIFEKLSMVPGSRKSTQWDDTHPSSPERLQIMLEASKTVNWRSHGHCNTLVRNLESIGIKFW